MLAKTRRKTIKVLLAIIVILHLSLQLLIYFWQYDVYSAEAKFDLHHLAEHESLALVNGLESYTDTMYAFRGVTTIYPDASKLDLDNFFESFALTERYPAVEAVFYINRTTRTEEKSLLAKMEAEFGNQEAYKDGIYIFPESNTEEKFIIDYFYPARENKRVIGFDSATDPSRYAAMMQAADLGTPVATDSIILLNDQTQSPANVIYLPIYRNNSDISSVASRRANLEGFVGIGFRIATALESIFHHSEVLTDTRLEFFTSKYNAEADRHELALIYDNGVSAPKDTPKEELELEFASKTWILCLKGANGRYIVGDDKVAIINTIFLAMTIGSLVFARILYVMITTRFRWVKDK